MALDEILFEEQFSSDTITEMIKDLKEIDHSLFRQIVYGVIENLYYLDFILKKFIKLKINKIDKKIINIIRIAIYELVFLDIKSYAIINEAVNNTKKINFKLKNFVNGVLRNIDRNIEKAKEIKEEDFSNYDDYISTKYSVNLDIINYLKKYYKNYVEIIKSFNKKPSFSIRVNTFLIYKEELMQILKNKGYEIEESEISKDSLIIKNPNKIMECSEFNDGFFTIQDESSALVAEIMNPKENSDVLDLCAAPGSKSTHILQKMNDKGFILSNDISKEKLKLIKENYDRLKLKNYKIISFNAINDNKDLYNKFDYVLVDAPCSGLGVVKRKPEIKIRRFVNDIYSLSNIQKEIINRAYNYLKSGGILIYSTCTLGNVENQDVLEQFLDKFKDMKLVEINHKKYIELLPNETYDGFFISKLLKM